MARLCRCRRTATKPWNPCGVRAQEALGSGRGRLLVLDSSGNALDGGAPLKRARLQPAEPNLKPKLQPLTLLVRSVHVCGRRGAFAAILADGSLVSWGDADCRGDSSAVREQLQNVQQIQATERAFAAILGDGSVVTWGGAAFGGDSRAVRDQLKNVQQIQAASCAFAAILVDGSVVTWGHADYGGDSSAVREQLHNVQQIQAT